MEPEENRKPIILVYFKLRGKLQPIRNIIAYLGLPFFEVHLDDETQRKSLDREITNCLRGLKIDKSSLPLMVYEGRHIYETLPIMNFICRRFGAEELMGRNIRQRVPIALGRHELTSSWTAGSTRRPTSSETSSNWPNSLSQGDRTSSTGTNYFSMTAGSTSQATLPSCAPC